jgi:signal transduction histidine kinase
MFTVNIKNNSYLVYFTALSISIGIPEIKIVDWFELFEDNCTCGTENQKSLRQGLNLKHEFVLMNKGEIEVESKVGVGTKFILQF